jgi:signal peptide peptidase SppA
MPQLLRIATEICNRPLLVLPETAETIYAVLESRIDISGGAQPKGESQANRHIGKPAGPRRDDGSTEYMYRLDADTGIALLPVMGELVNRGSWLDSLSGMTSYERLDAQLRAAIADPRVKALVLDMNSPGGQASGAMETADLVRQLSSQKPIVAFVNGMAASAAYAIAAGAPRVVVTPSAIAGSIGVVWMHVDRSGAHAKAGVKPTLLHAGAHKVDGNSLAALPDDARARIQAQIDGVYDLFVSSVAKHRKGLDASAVRATEAGVFMGQAAVDAKLADAVGTLDEVMLDLKAGKVALGASAPRLDALGAPASAGSYGEHRDRIKSIVTHESARACPDLALHLAFGTDLPLHNALALLKISADTVQANAARPSAAPVHTPRLMRDPASDRPLNSAAAMGALSPEEVARRVSGAG